MPQKTAAQALLSEEQILIKKQNPRLPFHSGLERYALLKKMGDGAFSVVYKAYDIKTETEVAVKVVRKHELSNTQVSFFFYIHRRYLFRI